MGEKHGPSFVMSDAEAPISFSAFILGLASTTLIHLGVTPNPETGQRGVDLGQARQSIDVLDLLRARTRGNLTSDEEQLFTSVLTDLRMRYVEKSTASE
jgi:hypothetical protein